MDVDAGAIAYALQRFEYRCFSSAITVRVAASEDVGLDDPALLSTTTTSPVKYVVRPATPPLRIAFLTEIPAPFRIPLFNALAERAELRVLFLAPCDPRRSHYDPHEEEWRFDQVFLRGASSRHAGAGRW